MATDTKNDKTDDSDKTTVAEPVQRPNIPAGSITDQLSDIPAKVADKIKGAESILVALSRDPSVDEISAAIGLTMLLDKIGKHATAIYSGVTPNALEFLNPEATFEKDTNSLQDFIIAINKDKADHLRYKIEGDYVKVFITPYRTVISEADLEFDRGDYNVDLVLTIDVESGDDIDGALAEYGRIMHDATAVNITVGTPGHFAETEWSDMTKSSVCEMIVNLAEKLEFGDFDANLSTALLTGIVSATNRFSNERTTPETMTIASRLMSTGADQKLISTNIMQPGDAAAAPEQTDVQEAVVEQPEIDPTAAALAAAAAGEQAANLAAAAGLATPAVGVPTATTAATLSATTPAPSVVTPQDAPIPVDPMAAAKAATPAAPVLAAEPAPAAPAPAAPAVPAPIAEPAPAAPAPAAPEVPVAAPAPIAAPAPAAPEVPVAAPAPALEPIVVSQPGMNPAVAAAPTLSAAADETVPNMQFGAAVETVPATPASAPAAVAATPATLAAPAVPTLAEPAPSAPTPIAEPAPVVPEVPAIPAVPAVPDLIPDPVPEPAPAPVIPGAAPSPLDLLAAAPAAEPVAPIVPAAPEAPIAEPTPSIPAVPATPIAPVVPEVPAAAEVPTIPEIPTVPEVSDVPEAPKAPSVPVFEPMHEEEIAMPLSRNDITPLAPTAPAIPPLPDFNTAPPAPNIDFSAPSMPPEIPGSPVYVPGAIPGATLESFKAPASISTNSAALVAEPAPAAPAPAAPAPIAEPALTAPAPAVDPVASSTPDLAAAASPELAAAQAAVVAQEAPKAASYTSFPPDPAAFQIPGHFGPQ